MPDNKSTRREFMKSAGAATLGAVVASGEARALTSNTHVRARELIMYVGTYTSGESVGIYLYRFNLAEGSLMRNGVATGVNNPSYLTLDRARRLLYAVEETDEFEGEKSGAVSAFVLDGREGRPRFVNR